VQDFKWMKGGPSPNWRILSLEKRLQEDVLEKLKKENVDVEEVIREVQLLA
jgi:hypothetical protein